MTAADLDGAETADDPIDWFRRELGHAQTTEVFDATRAALATTDAEGRPHVRFVLVKAADDRGFVFFTNLESPKARDIEANPHAALAFHWSSRGIQIRIEGTVERTESEEADSYFVMRPRGSQIGAWASRQSQPVADRAALDAQIDAARERFREGKVPRPPFWGSFRVKPTRIEFWRQRDDRLHDRWSYTRVDDTWRMQRLQP